MDPHQANLQPNLLLLGSRLRFNPTPTFLGVTFDRTLSFSKHVSSLKAKFFHVSRPYTVSLLPHGALLRSPSLFCINLFFRSFSRFTRMVCFLKRYQFHKIGTLPPSGQSRHHRLPFVLPYLTSSLRGFFTSPTSYPNSFHSYLTSGLFVSHPPFLSQVWPDLE